MEKNRRARCTIGRKRDANVASRLAAAQQCHAAHPPQGSLMSSLQTKFTTALIALFLAASVSTARADIYDDAVAHAGRSAEDIKRDPVDKPAEMLRLSGIKPGMQVADFLA